MLGAIIGDIVGSRWEFNPTHQYDFELFGLENGFTDDTICTCAVAESLLTGRDYATYLRQWGARYPNPKGGYGSLFKRWLADPSMRAYGSFGNGSAMRVSPVAWFEHDVFEVLREAGASAACTHSHPEGVKGAQAVALAIFYCRALLRKKSKVGPQEVMEGLRRALRFSGYDLHIRLEEVMDKFDETCPGTVPVAFWVVSQSHGFEDALRKAVILGADADTLGAIVGSIAEAIWGIPEWMKVRALSYLTPEMKDLLYQFRLRTSGHFPKVELV